MKYSLLYGREGVRIVGYENERGKGGRIRSLSREAFSRLLVELPAHLADMARFAVATGLRQANVTRLQWRQISLERRHLCELADAACRARSFSRSDRWLCSGSGTA